MKTKDKNWTQESNLDGEKILVEMKTPKSFFKKKSVKPVKLRKEFNVDEYVPKIYDKGSFPKIQVLLKTMLCGICKTPMLPDMHKFFPIDRWNNQKEQMIRGGIKEQSSVHDCNGKPICIDCKESGKIEFTCRMCEQKKPSSKIQESFGYSEGDIDYLCTDCYETCPAKIWDEKVEELNSEHKYDYE